MSQQYAERIERLSVKVPEAGCWIWVGTAGRYGKFFHEGRPKDAHRAAWLVFKGPIPQGMRVCHSCDVPLCVNPDHLFLGTAKDNTLDMMKKGRHKYATWNAPSGANHWTKKGN